MFLPRATYESSLGLESSGKFSVQSRVCINSLNSPTTLSGLFQARNTEKVLKALNVKVLSELIKKIAFPLKRALEVDEPSNKK